MADTKIDQDLSSVFNKLKLVKEDNNNNNYKCQVDDDSIEIIKNENFKKLDQILIHENIVFLVDWGEPSCIHVLDINMNYKTQIPIQANYIEIINNYNTNEIDKIYICILNHDFIKIIKFDRTTNLYSQIDECKINLDNIHFKGVRAYGLLYNQTRNEIYFLETNSCSLIIFDLKPLRFKKLLFHLFMEFSFIL